ncbi:unnamed protein product [Durusdinium trenchii]|uniref:Dynamin N-terminal domain-containing protein n=2 Tax=Durusdinium trenchii TaxID=1381693 RepID=A0ABP0K383_9DINO
MANSHMGSSPWRGFKDQGSPVWKAYSALKSVQEMDPNLLQVPVPVLVMMGMQSAGKTSFIEAMVKFPVGFTDRCTGTRCPVRYILRSSSVDSYKVGGEVVKRAADVREKVREHMKRLAQTNSFSHEVLTVEISERNQMDMDITDLPGLKDQEERDAKEIASIVKAYVEKPYVIPVALCKAEKSEETQTDMEALKGVGLNPKKALVIVNYFNKQLYDLHTLSDFNDYCEGYLAKFHRAHFVMLHFKDGINKDRMSFEELRQYYERLCEEEEETIKKRIEDLKHEQESKTEVSRQVQEALGIKSAFGSMQSRLLDWMNAERSKIGGVLKERVKAVCSDCQILKEALSDTDAEAMREGCEQYLRDWVKTMRGAHEAKHNYILSRSKQEEEQEEEDAQLGRQLHWAYDTKDRCLAHTFEEEWRKVPRAVKDKPTSKSWKMDKLQEELQRTHTGELMLMNLMPHAAYSRSVKVYGQVIMKYPMRKFSRADVYNISGHCNDGMTGSFNKHAVLKEMVTERLLDLQDIVEALLEHIKVIYLAPLERIHQLLSGQHHVVSTYTGLKNLIDETYRKLLNAQLKKTAERIHEHIHQTTACVSVGLPTRLLALSLWAANPEGRMAEEDTPEEKPASHDEEWVPNDDASEEMGAASHEDVGHRQQEVKRRVAQHNTTVKKVKEVLRPFKQSLSVEEFVEGGCEDFPPEDSRTLDLEQLNQDAKHYFLLLKGLLLLNIEMALDHHVYAFLSGELLGDMYDKMSRHLNQAVSKDEDLRKMVGGEEKRKELQGELDKKEEELKKLQEAEKLLDCKADLGRATHAGA